MADSLNSITANRHHERRWSSFEALPVIQAKKGELNLGLVMAPIEEMADREYKLRISF